MSTDKKASLVDVVRKFTPDGQNPKVYMELIKRQILGVDKNGNNRPDEDLVYFLYVSHKTGLDPLARQIFAVYRWDGRLGKERMTIQTSIDGLRLIAQRSGLYGGQDDVVFDVEDVDHPNKATVTVYRLNPKTGERIPTTATARWKEYASLDKNGKPTGMWAKMPYLMLGKVAEALALRKAFPAELSGLYTTEEMAQASNPLTDLPQPKPVKIKEVKAEPKQVEAPKQSNVDLQAQLLEKRQKLAKKEVKHAQKES